MLGKPVDVKAAVHGLITLTPAPASTYDALSRLTSTTDSDNHTLAYQYCAAGDRTQITWPDGGANALAVQYAYDNLRRVTSMTENSSYTLAALCYDTYTSAP